MPPLSREDAAAAAAEEIAAYAFIRARMADDVDKGMLLIEQHHVPPEAALFVMSLVKAATRALLSAEGFQVERALTVLDQWLENASERAALVTASREDYEKLIPAAGAIIRAAITGDSWTAQRAFAACARAPMRQARCAAQP
jgi:hypothetical protein